MAVDEHIGRIPLQQSSNADPLIAAGRVLPPRTPYRDVQPRRRLSPGEDSGDLLDRADEVESVRLYANTSGGKPCSSPRPWGGSRFDLGYAQVADGMEDALSGVGEYRIDDAVLSLSRRLNPNQLRSLDALHLASALQVDADLLLTYDRRLADAAEYNGCVASHPVAGIPCRGPIKR